jgi:putative spermidine/putrescine transport system substrate-binding protein
MKRNKANGPILTRRSMLNLMAVTGVGMSAVLTGCDSSSSSSDNNTDSSDNTSIEGAYDSNGAQLVISTWGFNSDQKQELVFEPFESAYNCTITTDEGNNGPRLSKVQEDPSSYDIVQFSDYYMQQAIDSGLIAEVDASKLTNLDAVYDKAKYPNGTDYGPAYTFNRLGIVYDKSTITDPITSWADLWRDDLAGKVTIPDFSTTAGPWMVNMAANQLGQELSEDNVNAAFEKLGEMKENIAKLYTSSSDVVNMFNQGEVSVAVLQDFSSQTLQEASDDYVWVDPSEGTWGGVNCTNVCAQSKNFDLAMAFINYTLDKDEQQRNVSTGDSPSRPDVTLTDEQAKIMTYGQSVVDSINMPNDELLIQNKSDWQALWNQTLAS